MECIFPGSILAWVVGPWVSAHLFGNTGRHSFQYLFCTTQWKRGPAEEDMTIILLPFLLLVLALPNLIRTLFRVIFEMEALGLDKLVETELAQGLAQT